MKNGHGLVRRNENIRALTMEACQFIVLFEHSIILVIIALHIMIALHFNTLT